MQSRNVWFLVLVVVLTALSIFGYVKKDLKKGLDVAGGIRLTYRMDINKLTAEQRKNISRIQSQVQGNLERRASSALGVVEASVTTKGEDQFVVELPGATKVEDARTVLSSTAKVQVYHAKNVSTGKRSKRYIAGTQLKNEDGSPYVTFSRVGSTSSELKPGDPEYAKMIEGWELILEGQDVIDAKSEIVGTNSARPSFTFGGEGARRLVEWSRKYLNEGEQLAFVLDGSVLQISPKQDGAILDGGAYIDGKFDPAYVRQLTSLIKAGSLPVDLIEEASETVSPTIGEKAFGQMIIAGGISLGIIIVYLIGYYSFPGVIAAVAMILYTLFTITVLKWMGATFSLASVAGLILSAGMAVDANILVFERLKEEVRAGRKLSTAVELGFKRALSAILDSNACTIITSIVLYALGTSAVKGFATALVIGVLISFFTAITVTRSLLIGLTSIGIGTDPKWYGLNRSLFGEKLEANADTKRIQIIGKSKRWFTLSALFILPGLVFIALGGIKPNVEFQGGYEANFILKQDVPLATVRANLEKAGYEGFNLKEAKVNNLKSIYITIPKNETKIKPKDPEALKTIGAAAGLDTADGGLQEIGPSVRAETTNNAILGVALATAFIVLYIAVRFGFALGGMKNGLKFGLSGVAAMLHDVVFILGTAAIVGKLLGWEISSLFITAMLTVIGFSVHDTIVIFDRIRENLRKSRGAETFEDLCDKSVTQTIARSINTSFTAALTLVVVFFFSPTPELKFMILVMFLGIIIGTYSSIFNASPILWLWNRASVKRKGPDEDLVVEAQHESKLRAAQVVAAPSQEGTVSASDYGTIRRKQSVKEQASHVLDDED
ncbi:MAG: protein translocase subunit SecD [Fimbriimonadaceae bacterium]|nr:MAG: protein translocase subunit SecD [Fimbriimonadaceae bacterium]